MNATLLLSFLCFINKDYRNLLQYWWRYLGCYVNINNDQLKAHQILP